MKCSLLLFTATLFGLSRSTIYFSETFETDPFSNDRWILSNWKKDSGEQGKLEWSGGIWGAGERKGIRTTEDAKFYAFTSKLENSFNNEGKTLVFGFSVKHEQKIDCGGGYAKLLPPNIDPKEFNGETDYTIMFGPDICGYSTKKVQAIFNYKEENLLRNSDVSCPDDEYTHQYVFIVNPDETYEIRVDGEEKAKGSLKTDWSFEKPKKIKDPEAKKPDDWVDEEMMDDPKSVKPEDWDDEPEKIADPEASKPDDWDDEEDGEWEAPQIDNPEYKGVWKPDRIKNPDYKGAWVHPEIDNPEFVEEKDVYKRGDIGFIGVEIWQVKSGTVFSDFILTDDVKEAEDFLSDRSVNNDDEKAAKEAYDKENEPSTTDDESTDTDEEDSELEDEDKESETTETETETETDEKEDKESEKTDL